MPAYPRLTTRSTGYVELVLRNTTDVAGYRFAAANTLDAAFASPTTMFTLPRGATFRSSTLQKKRLGTSVYTSRGLTIAQYDPEDFWAPGGNLPHDVGTSYVVVTEQNSAGTFRPNGPILVVPPPGFFVTTRPNLVLAGTAPEVAASDTGVPPAGALHFVLPRFADSVTVTNNGGGSLFIAFGAQTSEMEVLDGTTTSMFDATVSEVFVRGEGSDISFSMFLAIVNAEMA